MAAEKFSVGGIFPEIGPLEQKGAHLSDRADAGHELPIQRVAAAVAPAEERLEPGGGPLARAPQECGLVVFRREAVDLSVALGKGGRLAGVGDDLDRRVGPEGFFRLAKKVARLPVARSRVRSCVTKPSRRPCLSKTACA